MSSSLDEQAGSSGAAEQGLGESDNMEVRGGRFSKSAEERQKMLKQRKEEMLQQARRLVHCRLEFSTSMGRGAKLFYIQNKNALFFLFENSFLRSGM